MTSEQNLLNRFQIVNSTYGCLYYTTAISLHLILATSKIEQKGLLFDSCGFKNGGQKLHKRKEMYVITNKHYHNKVY